MMRRLQVCLGLLGLLWAMPVHAQATTTRAEWDISPNAGQTLPDIQSFTYTLKVDAAAAVILTGVQCGALLGTPPSSHCTAPIANLSSGIHTLVLTATNAFGSASSTITGAPPGSPQKFTITITVTVP